MLGASVAQATTRGDQMFTVMAERSGVESRDKEAAEDIAQLERYAAALRKNCAALTLPSSGYMSVKPMRA